MARKRSKGKILIKKTSEIGIHHRNVIRPRGGGRIPLDEFKYKEAKGRIVEAVGLKNTGWHLPGSEFIRRGKNHALILPAYGSKKGGTRHVMAVIDRKPRVYKFALEHKTPASDMKVALETKKFARKICSVVPAAKFIKVRKVPRLEFKKKGSSKAVLVEEHEFIASGWDRDGKLISRNLAEELLETPDELTDITRQVTKSVIELFNHGIMFTDTKPENFVRDYRKDKKHPYGIVKIVDHDADERLYTQIRKNDPRFSAEEKDELVKDELDLLAYSLSKFVRKLSASRKHRFKINNVLKKEIRAVVIEEIKANLPKNEAKPAINYFMKPSRGGQKN